MSVILQAQATNDPPASAGDLKRITQTTSGSKTGLDVAIIAGGGGGGGTQYTEDVAAAADPVGTAQNLIRQDTPAPLVSADGDNVARRGTNFGAAYSQIVSSTGSFIDTFGGGTQYTEGATDPTITGTAAMMEGAADTLLPIQGTIADGLLVNLGSNNDVNVTSGSVTVNNAAGASAVNIQDGGNSITVDGSVSITGTVDTELPAAVALADNTANPTVPGVGAFLMSFDGTTWDRAVSGPPAADNLSSTALTGLVVLSTLYGFDGSNFDRIRLEGSTQGVTVGGSIAHDAADSGNPISIGLNARQTNPTAVADADRVRSIGDDIGRQVVVLNHVRDLVTDATATLTSTTETTVLAAAASTFHDVTEILLTNTSQTATRVDIRDTTAGSVRFSMFLVPGGSAVIPFAVPLKQATVNTNWTAQLSVAVTDVRVAIQAVKNV